MDLKNKIKRFFISARDRDILLYLLFVLISFIFWAILSLSNSIQSQYKVKLQIEGIPNEATIISEYPETFDVSVKHKGYSFVKYLMGRTPTVSVNFIEYSDGKGNLTISKQEMEGLLRNLFGSESTITSFSPEEIYIRYTNQPGKKVPVVLDGDFTADIQYVKNGRAVVVPDSVVIYADPADLNTIEHIATDRIVRHNLKDTLEVTAALEKHHNVKIVPDSVSVTVPVESLVRKTQELVVNTVNCPNGERIIVFPAKVKVSYLLPISMYGRTNGPAPRVCVDYLDIKNGGRKLPLRIEEVPAPVSNVVMSVDSVEYIRERRM